jgi:hypothetical protein
MTPLPYGDFLPTTNMTNKPERSVEDIKAEFQMFVPDDDGSAMDWLENTLQAERQKREEMVEWAEREVYALSETLKKSKEMVSVGHKKVYNHIKIVGELEGKLEVWQEILDFLTQPTPLTNDKE